MNKEMLKLVLTGVFGGGAGVAGTYYTKKPEDGAEEGALAKGMRYLGAGMGGAGVAVGMGDRFRIPGILAGSAVGAGMGAAPNVSAYADTDLGKSTYSGLGSMLSATIGTSAALGSMLPGGVYNRALRAMKGMDPQVVKMWENLQGKPGSVVEAAMTRPGAEAEMAAEGYAVPSSKKWPVRLVDYAMGSPTIYDTVMRHGDIRKVPGMEYLKSLGLDMAQGIPVGLAISPVPIGIDYASRKWKKRQDTIKKGTHMDLNQIYSRGFMQKCAEAGLTEKDAFTLAELAGAIGLTVGPALAGTAAASDKDTTDTGKSVGRAAGVLGTVAGGIGATAAAAQLGRKMDGPSHWDLQSADYAKDEAMQNLENATRESGKPRTHGVELDLRSGPDPVDAARERAAKAMTDVKMLGNKTEAAKAFTGRLTRLKLVQLAKLLTEHPGKASIGAAIAGGLGTSYAATKAMPKKKKEEGVVDRVKKHFKKKD